MVSRPRSLGKIEDTGVRMLSLTINCGTETYLAFYLGEQAKPEASGRDLLLGARCSKNPKRPPPFAEVARKACARGDERGCEAAADQCGSAGGGDGG